MGSGPIRIVCLGRASKEDVASRIGASAESMGAKVDYAADNFQGSEIDQGSIDWRGSLSSANWLLVSSSSVLEGDGMRGAWGASLTFSELEGSKTAMVVEVPDDESRMGEAWGSVIERIRQVSVLFLTQKAMDALMELEGVDDMGLIGEIRSKSLVPIVCSFHPVSGIALVSHSLGDEVVEVQSGMGFERWLAGFLCGLSYSGSGSSGIMLAALSEYP
jgi:hypothetical protein